MYDIQKKTDRGLAMSNHIANLILYTQKTSIYNTLNLNYSDNANSATYKAGDNLGEGLQLTDMSHQAYIMMV